MNRPRGRGTFWGKPHAKRKFSAEQVLQIRELAAGGIKRYEIAKAYKCGSSTINQIVNRETYRDI